MSPAWIMTIAIPIEISRQYLSHAEGSRNLTTASGGSRRSSISKRRRARQSITGTFAIDEVAIAVGAVPFSRRTTMAPASRA